MAQGPLVGSMKSAAALSPRGDHIIVFRGSACLIPKVRRSAEDVLTGGDTTLGRMVQHAVGGPAAPHFV